jgi:hypothetical protein
LLLASGALGALAALRQGGLAHEMNGEPRLLLIELSHQRLGVVIALRSAV